MLVSFSSLSAKRV